MRNTDTVTLKGVVVHGKGLGRTVGMPTANLALYDGQEAPEDGVYATKVKVAGIERLGLTNIGARPTVDNENKKTIETHILDFNQDIYDEEISVEICFKIRDIIKFNSLEEVKKQVDKDKAVILSRVRNQKA